MMSARQGLACFAAGVAAIAVVIIAIPRGKSVDEVLAEADRLLRIRCVEAYGAANLTWCLDRINAKVQRQNNAQQDPISAEVLWIIDEQQKRAARR